MPAAPFPPETQFITTTRDIETRNGTLPAGSTGRVLHDFASGAVIADFQKPIRAWEVVVRLDDMEALRVHEVAPRTSNIEASQ